MCAHFAITPACVRCRISKRFVTNRCHAASYFRSLSFSSSLSLALSLSLSLFLSRVMCVGALVSGCPCCCVAGVLSGARCCSLLGWPTDETLAPFSVVHRHAHQHTFLRIIHTPIFPSLYRCASNYKRCRGPAHNFSCWQNGWREEGYTRQSRISSSNWGLCFCSYSLSMQYFTTYNHPPKCFFTAAVLRVAVSVFLYVGNDIMCLSRWVLVCLRPVSLLMCVSCRPLVCVGMCTLHVSWVCPVRVCFIYASLSYRNLSECMRVCLSGSCLSYCLYVVSWRPLPVLGYWVILRAQGTPTHHKMPDCSPSPTHHQMPRFTSV